MLRERENKQPGRMDRRSFLKWAGMAGGGALVAVAVPTVFSQRFNRELHQVRHTRLMMGTFVQITTLDPSQERAAEAVERAFTQMARLESLLTRFDANSPVGQLNDTGRLDGPPPELLQVLAGAQQVHRATHGAFDITVLPLLTALESSVSAGQVSDPARLKAAAELVGLEHLQAGQRSVRLTRSGMGITLDGIAKGYIVDQGLAALSQAGVTRALINAGGDIRSLGVNRQGQPWQVAVQDPAKKDGVLTVIGLQDRAVATSGNYEVYFDNQKLFGHILDPKEAGVPSQAASVSITAPTAMMADAMATAVFALGARRGMEVLEARAELGAYVLDRQGSRRSLRFGA